MSKKMAGKTFSTPEEAGIAPPTEAELAEARKQFKQLQERIDRIPEQDRKTSISPKFWDDTSGTEYEGWQER